MKVLWFSNTPGLAAEFINKPTHKGGWINAIQMEIEKREDFELGFVFYEDNVKDEFKLGKTTYFPVRSIRKKNKLLRLVQRLNVEVEYDENLDLFLGIVEKFEPDVIHIFGTENPFGLIINKIANIPVVIWIQGNLNVYKHKFFSGIAIKNSFGLSGSVNNDVKQNYFRLAKKANTEKEILKNCSYIMGRTDWDRKITKILAPKAEYFYVNELARPSFYNHKWKYTPSSNATLFTTSGPGHYKGFETILDCATQLKNIDFQFRWIVAGLSQDDNIVKLSMNLRNVKDLDLLNIKLIGKVTEEKLVDKMLESSMYIQVSHIENSPNSLFEAMLLGMPIIASDVGGTASLIQNNQDGVLVQDGDPFVLAGAIVELTEEKHMLKALGEKAYEVSHKRHNPKLVVDQLLKAYLAIIKLNKSSI